MKVSFDSREISQLHHGPIGPNGFISTTIEQREQGLASSDVNVAITARERGALFARISGFTDRADLTTAKTNHHLRICCLVILTVLLGGVGPLPQGSFSPQPFTFSVRLRKLRKELGYTTT